jgi:hypothetical protein
MRFTGNKTLLSVVIFGGLGLAGCDSTSESSVEETNNVKDVKGIDISKFKDGAFSEQPKIVDCETGEGTVTTCYQLVTTGAPAGRAPGPFCPRTIDDGADVTGGWFNKSGSGELVDLTGNFILKLAEYYGDEKWVLYDAETKKIRYTATKESCDGAARPDVQEEYKQNCIECELSYLEDDFSLTYLIPTTPIPSSSSDRVHTVGIALDGTQMAGPAPTDEILGSYTIAAFDDCGGHINLHQGYHYHSTNGCSSETATEDGHAPLVGYAMDGYGIYAMKDAQGKEPEDLDECRGHSDDVLGYHYHAASPSENMFIGCMRGETVKTEREPDGGPGGPGGPGHDH